MKWIALVSGGTLGTLARYWFGGAVYQTLGASFPYGTLVVNLTGCWLIGLLTVLAEEKFLLGPSARVFLMIGFCGAYTTFSTFMLETADLMKSGENFRAFMNVFPSVVAGFLALRAGILTAKFF
ncbi:MAG TPA: fluoride efflux transporter CrcB [Candidatus Omnitrophota bacterium]|jgi:CrcB protein|nr:fluoride efflux transporter CrcB [Candidatus Omnitrophota bacterium]HQB93624.1 fluoride efflux transporter CrcB [Candidatus Omnitrophota bacterium]